MTTNRQQNDTNKNVKNDKNIKKKNIYTPDFENFWKAYPNHASGKIKAFEAWEKAFKKHPDLKVETIMESIRDHIAQSWAWKRGAVTYATTWLNQGRWTAEFGKDDDF